MDFFNKKKLVELRYENTCLKDRVAELEEALKNNRIEIPKKKKLIFEYTDKWSVTVHFDKVLNCMNANSLQIFDVIRPRKLENGNFGFEISYRLPENIQAIDFNCTICGGEYESKFIIYKNTENKGD